MAAPTSTRWTRRQAGPDGQDGEGEFHVAGRFGAGLWPKAVGNNHLQIQPALRTVANRCERLRFVAFGCVSLRLVAFGCIWLRLVAFGCVWSPPRPAPEGPHPCRLGETPYRTTMPSNARSSFCRPGPTAEAADEKPHAGADLRDVFWTELTRPAEKPQDRRRPLRHRPSRSDKRPADPARPLRAGLRRQAHRRAELGCLVPLRSGPAVRGRRLRQVRPMPGRPGEARLVQLRRTARSVRPIPSAGDEAAGGEIPRQVQEDVSLRHRALL